MLLVSYIQQYFNTSITVLTNQVWKLLIALYKVPNTGAFTVLESEEVNFYYQNYIFFTQNNPNAILNINVQIIPPPPLFLFPPFALKPNNQYFIFPSINLHIWYKWKKIDNTWHKINK